MCCMCTWPRLYLVLGVVLIRVVGVQRVRHVRRDEEGGAHGPLDGAFSALRVRNHRRGQTKVQAEEDREMPKSPR